MSELRTFEELDCYQSACALRKNISKFCRTLPIEEKHRLKDQVIRSSRSVCANIAEGYGRHHHQENIQFCRMARGSLSETLEHVNTAHDECYLMKDEYERLRSAVAATWKSINGYIAYLMRCADSGVPGKV